MGKNKKYKKNILIVVDMQKDFVTGELGTPEAQSIVPKIKQYAKKFDGVIFFTRDTHFGDYFETQEGEKLPIKHCTIGSVGWEIVPELNDINHTDIQKSRFASLQLAQRISYYDDFCEQDLNVYLCGVCTDICVISNAMVIKAFAPEVKVYVLKDLCAGTSQEKHDAALNVMESCQINVIESGVKA